MFVALTLLVAYLPTVPGSAFKFMGLPLLLGGLLIGPRTGFAIGCLTDIINFALHPSGFFFPGFTLTQGLTAMIPGLMTRGIDPLTGLRLVKESPSEPALEGALPPRYARWRAIVRLLWIFGLTKVITSVLMVSYFTSNLVGTPIEYELSHRAMIQLVHVPIYAVLSVLVLEGLAPTDLYRRILKARR